MRKLLILLLSILFPLLSSAQKGSVMTPDKKPIAGVLVTLSKTDSTFVKSVATDTAGRFDLMSDVRPYLLSFDHSAYAPKSIRARRSGGKPQGYGTICDTQELPPLRRADGQVSRFSTRT